VQSAADMHDALRTAIGWRRSFCAAQDRDGGGIVAANGVAAAKRPAEASLVSRPLEFGGLALRLLTESRDAGEPNREIPAIVTDTMLRRIVEAHFAVWYVWHVPTGTCIVPGMQELLGIPRDEVPTIVEDWLGRVHPHDLPRMVAENDEALRNNAAFRSEYRLRRGDGGYISISDWGIVLSGETGGAEWMAGGLRDITIEKTLEQAREEASRLRDVLFKHAPVPTFLIDAAGAIVDASQSALDFLQAPRNAVVGHDAAGILPADLVARTRGSHDEEVTVAGTTEEVELEVGGVRKWLLATAVPFAVADRHMAFVLGADVTERKHAAEALAASEASLREKSLALEQHNIALRVLIDQRRSDLEERERILADNLEQLVFPTLDRLAEAFANHPEAALLDVVRQTLREIADPLLEKPGASGDAPLGLSRREYQVLQLVRSGRTTEEIAQALYLSPATVTFHRGNIRRKLGLKGSGLRLASRVAVETVSRRTPA
jgi:PAS domain S-box-containing protein